MVKVGFDMWCVDENGDSIHGGCEVEAHGDHYWRRNIFGGRPQAQKLVDIGIGYWSDLNKRGPWPSYEDYGLVENPDYIGETGTQQFLGARLEEYLHDRNAHLRATYDERPGIAVYKLCDTNDGWWVTQAECRSALAMWDAAGQPDVDDGYGDTIPFLRASADHNGFRVW
jgi:hypothetical protein